MIPRVHILVSESIAVVDSECLFKFNIGLSLLRGGDICVIRVVKTLLLQDLFDAIYIFDNFQGHVGVLPNVFIEGNKLYSSYNVHKVSAGHPRNQLAFGYNNYEYVGFDINDSNNSLSGVLNTALLVSWLFL